MFVGSSNLSFIGKNVFTWFTVFYNKFSILIYLIINKRTLSRQRTLKESVGYSQVAQENKTFLAQARHPAIFQLNASWYLASSSIRASFLFRETKKLLICFLLNWLHIALSAFLLLKNSQKPLVLRYIFKHQWKGRIIPEFQVISLFSLELF